MTGRDVYNDSYTLSSVIAFSQTGNPAELQSVVTDLVQPEKVTAYDIGYRGRIGKINVDVNGYYNSYDGFISNTTVATPNSGSTSDITGVIDIVTGNFRFFQTYTNSKGDVSSYGLNIGLDTKIFNRLNIGANYTYAKLDFDQATDPDFSVGFNTPEHKVKFSLGGEIFENMGFNVNVRWSDEYLWQASIANALIPSRTVVDAQINYAVPKLKSVFKIGATNLGGDEYQSAVGTAFIGSQYYVSWVINQ